MPRKRNADLSAPFQTIPAATRITGLPQGWLRAGCKAGEVPHVRSGNVYLVNIPALLKKLGAEEAG